MLICFELSMPGCNSWDGKWSGEGGYYALVENIPNKKAEEILKTAGYRYNFGDGWSAYVSVRQVDSREAAKIRRKSRGFCGYDWMVKSICKNLKIIPS